MRGLIGQLSSWFRAPLRARWSWPTPAWVQQRSAAGGGAGAADLRPLRFTDVTRESLQIANVSDSEAVEVTLLTFEVGEEGASERRGDLPGLGPGACYVVPLARDVASAPELEAGTWVRVSWQNQDGSSEERWGQAGEDGTIVERQPSEGQS